MIKTSHHLKRNALLYLNTIALILTIVIALLFYFKASKSASAVATELREIGQEYIEYTVAINDTIPLVTDINIENNIPVALQMSVDHSLPIHMLQKVKDSFSLPIHLQISDVLHVDTTLELPDTLQLYTTGVIPIDQKFEILGNKNLKFKAKSSIPLQQTLKAKVLGKTSFSSAIPVRLNINEQIPITLNLNIPIDQVIPIHLPIRSTANVSFPEKLRIKGFVPLHLKVPIRIPLSATPLKPHLDKAANHLDEMFKF